MIIVTIVIVVIVVIVIITRVWLQLFYSTGYRQKDHSGWISTLQQFQPLASQGQESTHTTKALLTSVMEELHWNLLLRRTWLSLAWWFSMPTWIQTIVRCDSNPSPWIWFWGDQGSTYQGSIRSLAITSPKSFYRVCLLTLTLNCRSSRGSLLKIPALISCQDTSSSCRKLNDQSPLDEWGKFFWSALWLPSWVWCAKLCLDLLKRPMAMIILIMIIMMATTTTMKL